MTKLNKLNTFALTLLITGAIDSIRNLPAALLALPWFSSLSLQPLFSHSNCTRFSRINCECGWRQHYKWAKLAFGKRMRFLAVWLQWINNLVWFPNSFLYRTAAYLIDPALAQTNIMVAMFLHFLATHDCQFARCTCFSEIHKFLCYYWLDSSHDINYRIAGHLVNCRQAITNSLE